MARQRETRDQAPRPLEPTKAASSGRESEFPPGMFDDFDVTAGVLSDESEEGGGRGGEQAELSEAPWLRQIKQIKEKYEGEWMGRIEGVNAVEIGQDEKSGKPAIVVLVSEKTKSLQQQIPEEVEGYPVRIEVSGELNILPANVDSTMGTA